MPFVIFFELFGRVLYVQFPYVTSIKIQCRRDGGDAVDLLRSKLLTCVTAAHHHRRRSLCE